VGAQDPFVDPERLIRRVYAYVAYRLGDGPDAEDVTAEAIARALRYRDSFDSSRGDPAAWVIGIARRLLLSVRGTEPTLLLNEEARAADDLEESAVRRMSVRSAVARLGERDQELVALRYGADLNAREIGSLLEMKTNAVEVALHRAVGRLRSELASPSSMRSTAVVQPVPD
jgi:RNA polymerase sigma-70 factor (ECF subfamily)